MPRYFYDWKPYVPVATRRWQATRELRSLEKNGHPTSPVQIDGRKIAATFWGKAWCDNLERYSDYANRLPRGRTYVRNGSVVDLQIAQGVVTALVSGSDLYQVRIVVKAVPKVQWQGICRDCTGAIDSLVELLQGRLSSHVMNRICEAKTGLFPEPRDVTFECSCPDWAWMCKHVAAVLYGVGARLDERPELLFLLRGVDQEDLIAKAGTGLHPPANGQAGAKVLDSGDLSQMFGIELADPETTAQAPPARRKPKPRAAANPAMTPPTPAPAARPTRAKEAGSVKPAAAAASKTPKTSTPTRMLAKQRAIGERMKRYWRERMRRSRAQAAVTEKPIARPALESAPRERKADRRKPLSAAARVAISERMKRYWEMRRRSRQTRN